LKLKFKIPKLKLENTVHLNLSQTRFQQMLTKHSKMTQSPYPVKTSWNGNPIGETWSYSYLEVLKNQNTCRPLITYQTRRKTHPYKSRHKPTQFWRNGRSNH